MNKAYKKLGTNIVLFAISSFGTKILNFLLVPLYTSYLTTSEYGTVDILNTVLQLLLPVFSFNIASGVIRFALDKENDKREVYQNGTIINLLGFVALLIFGWIGFSIFDSKLKISYLIFLQVGYLLSAIYTATANYFRGIGKVREMVFAGILSTLTSCVSNIVSLVILRAGIDGYLISILLSYLIPSLYMIIVGIKSKNIDFRVRIKDKILSKNMIIYSAPLIANSISWWFNSSLDRFFVLAMCGVAANGLLAVSYKIPSILALFQTIFNQAWTMSAVEEFKKDNNSIFFSRIYSIYNCLMVIICSFLLIMNVFIAKILYANDFFYAWRYTGILVVSQLFGALSICISGVFDAVKDSKSLARTTIIGAIINTILNYVLILYFDVYGAVIATLISNIVIWVLRIVKVRKYIDIKIDLKRDLIIYFLLIFQCWLGLFPGHMYFLQLIIMCVIFVSYYKEEKQMISNILTIIKNKLLTN